MAGLVVNKGELARVFNVSEPTVGKWIVDGCPVHSRGASGVAYEFDVDQVKAWRVERAEAERAAAQEREQEINRRQAEMFGEQKFVPEGMSQEDIGTYLENMRLFEIVKKQRGEVIDRADVRNEFQAVFNVLRQHVLGWATTLARTAHLSAEQQRAAEALARGTLQAAWQQIKDPALRAQVEPDGVRP